MNAYSSLHTMYVHNNAVGTAGGVIQHMHHVSKWWPLLAAYMDISTNVRLVKSIITWWRLHWPQSVGMVFMLHLNAKSIPSWWHYKLSLYNMYALC